MLIRTVCILGGTGFVGRTLANRLTRDGIRIRILTRDREKHKDDLILLPTVDLIQADVYDPHQLQKYFCNCDAVINLVGILNEKGRDGKGFHKAHVELTEKTIDACQKKSVKRLLHMSALNADPGAQSHYLQTRGMAEKLVLEADSQSMRTTVFRPSVIFGREDSFFNRFATLLKLTPVFFPLACAHTRFAPVFVGDVAETFTLALTDSGTFGKKLDLCGPARYTLQELVEFTANCTGTRRKIIPLNDFLSRMQAMIFDYIPGKPFSTDNYLSARVDSVCAGENHLHQFVSHPGTIEAIVPGYLANRFERARYYQFRRQIHGHQAD